MTGEGGIDPALEALLDRAARLSEEAEVYYLHHREEPVMFEANRLKLDSLVKTRFEEVPAI